MMFPKECTRCKRLYTEAAWNLLDVDGFQWVPPSWYNPYPEGHDLADVQEEDEPGYFQELRTCSCNGTMAVDHPPGVDPRQPIDHLAEQVRNGIRGLGQARQVRANHRLLVLRVKVIGQACGVYTESWGLSFYTGPLEPLGEEIIKQVIAACVARGEKLP